MYKIHGRNGITHLAATVGAFSSQTEQGLSKALGVSTMAVAFWERGHRRIPPLLPLALEALEHRMKETGKHGFTLGMPKVQEEK